jgi:hypothetical protein
LVLKPCQGCGREVDSTAKACPGCGRPNPAGASVGRGRVWGGVAVGLLLVVGFVFVGRSKFKKNSDEANTTFAAPSTAPEAPPEAPRARFSESVASFNSDQLFECIDILVDFPFPDGGIDATKKDKFMELVEKSVFKNGLGKSTKLAVSCDDQFSDRHPFATCLIEHQWNPLHFSVDIKNYSFKEVFLSDAMMKSCIEGGGRWKGISRDSSDYRHAKLQFDMNSARTFMDKAARSLNE